MNKAEPIELTKAEKEAFLGLWQDNISGAGEDIKELQRQKKTPQGTRSKNKGDSGR